MVLTASVSDGAFDYLGSAVTEGFLDDKEDLRVQFLDHCMKGNLAQVCLFEELQCSCDNILEGKNNQRSGACTTGSKLPPFKLKCELIKIK